MCVLKQPPQRPHLGGNAGMAKLTDEIRALGYKWGSYTEAGTTGCDGSARSSEGCTDPCRPLLLLLLLFFFFSSSFFPFFPPFLLELPPWSYCPAGHPRSIADEDKDAALFFGEWQSEYLMIDSCGVKARPPPQGPPPGYPGGQARQLRHHFRPFLTHFSSYLHAAPHEVSGKKSERRPLMAFAQGSTLTPSRQDGCVPVTLGAPHTGAV